MSKMKEVVSNSYRRIDIVEVQSKYSFGKRVPTFFQNVNIWTTDTHISVCDPV